MPQTIKQLRAYLADLIILAVGLANTIALETATIPQRDAIRLLERYLNQIPASLRG